MYLVLLPLPEGRMCEIENGFSDHFPIVTTVHEVD